MIRRSGSRFLAAASLGLAATLATACSSTSSSAVANSSSAGQKLTPVTVGVLPISDNAPFFVALQRGYFKQAGLDVKPQIIAQSTSAIPDMLSGSVDIVAGGNYVSWLAGVASGALQLRIVAPSDQCGKNNLDVMVLPSSSIKSPKDLEGKTIAVNLLNNIQTLTIDAVLKADNVDTTKVKFVAIPFPAMATALKAGQIDAMASVEPFITSAEETLGAVPLLDECQGPTAGISVSGYWGTQSWVEKNPAIARAFQRAVMKAQALADGDRRVIEQVLPTYTKITPKIAQLISLPYYPTRLDTTQLQRVADLMLAEGMLKKPFDVSTVVFR